MDARDKAVIEILLKIARVCGTFPSAKPSRLAYSYQTVMFALNVTWSIASMWNNAKEIYFFKSSLDIFIDLLVSFCAMIEGSSMQLLSLYCPSGWRDLYKDLPTDSCKPAKGGVKVYLEILALHLFWSVRFAIVIWTWMPIMGWSMHKRYSFKQFNEYVSLISILLLVHVNIVIKRKFRLMNEMLRTSHAVRRVQVIYSKTTRLIDSFSCVFGYQILFIVAHAVVALLESLNTVLTYGDYSKTENVKITFWSVFYSFDVIVIIFRKKSPKFLL